MCSKTLPLCDDGFGTRAPSRTAGTCVHRSMSPLLATQESTAVSAMRSSGGRSPSSPRQREPRASAPARDRVCQDRRHDTRPRVRPTPVAVRRGGVCGERSDTPTQRSRGGGNDVPAAADGSGSPFGRCRPRKAVEIESRRSNDRIRDRGPRLAWRRLAGLLRLAVAHECRIRCCGVAESLCQSGREHRDLGCE